MADFDFSVYTYFYFHIYLYITWSDLHRNLNEIERAELKPKSVFALYSKRHELESFFKDNYIIKTPAQNYIILLKSKYMCHWKVSFVKLPVLSNNYILGLGKRSHLKNIRVERVNLFHFLFAEDNNCISGHDWRAVQN